MLITVNGLVTRSYPSGDHDRVVHMINEDRGRLAVMVKGGNSKRGSPAAACTQLFTYGNYELYSGNSGDIYWYRGGSVLNTFYNLSANLPRMALAAYLCDVASELTDKDAGEAETAELLRMLLNSLYTLDKGSKPDAIVKGVFELRAAAMMGYQPNLMGCAICKEGYPDEAYFDIMNGRIICADCQTKRNRLNGRFPGAEEELGERSIVCPVSASVLAAIRYALTAPDQKIFSFTLKDREEEYAFDRAAETFLLNQLERDFETLHFYRSVAD
ncbi:MAG: DNA repair protein RecO [Clostridia bacterium]|nr:DNA repair protein RecO [Clostridia bacterium]